MRNGEIFGSISSIRHIGLAMMLLLLLAGCRMGYLFHAGVGQFRLISDSVPVEEALAGDLLGPEEKQRLSLVSEISRFGVEELGLKETGSYRSIYLKTGRPPIYLVAAAPKDSLTLVTWWFPIVGDIPYLGYFDKDDALNEKKKLMNEGLDVHLGMAEAYSTLGWFDDPLTLNLIKGSAVDLAETILHEMTHATLYVSGQAAFNEGLAVLMGKVGAYRFFESRYGSGHPLAEEARRNLDDERLFSAFLDSLAGRLERIYASPVPGNEKMTRRDICYRDARAAFGRLKPRLQTRRYAAFGRRDLNNAYLAAILLYHRYFHVFEGVLAFHGNSLQKTLVFFKEIASEGGNLLEKTTSVLLESDHS